MHRRPGRRALAGRLAAVVILLCACAPVLAPARATAQEVRVDRIRFEGVDAVRKSELRDQMLTRSRSIFRFWRARPEFSQGVFDEDIERIEQVYRDHGYYDAVATGDVAFGDEGHRVQITIRVEEGEPVLLEALDVELGPGAPLSSQELVGALPIEPGDVFAVDLYQRARVAALAKLAELGHPAASLEGGAEVFVETRSARIDWRIDPGPHVSFGDVRINGLEDVDVSIVKREIDVVPGDSYSPRALRRTRDGLLRSRLFRYVSVQPERSAAPEKQTQATGSEGAGGETPEPGSESVAGETPEPSTTAELDGAEATVPAEETWPIVVQLDERPPRSIALGFGWASGQGPRGSGSWTHRNFFGGARRFRVGGSGSPLEQRAEIGLLQPYLLGTRASLAVDTQWRRKSRDSYDSNTAEFDIGPRWTFGRHWLVESSYRFGWSAVSNVKDQSNDVLRAQKDSGLLSSIGGNLRRAQLDHPTDPHAGTWVQIGVRANLKALGSDFDWMRYDAEARGYIPLGPTVFAVRGRYRLIDPLGSTSADEVPLGERLFLGGPHTGRGYPYEELGPLDANGEPVGGVSSFLLSAEWRVPVWGPVSVIGFVDVGQVSLEPFDFDADQTGIGTGAGLAFSTPIGPVAGHLAWPVRPLEVRQRLRFAITIGHSF